MRGPILCTWFLPGSAIKAQDIAFDKGHWETTDLTHQQKLVVRRANAILVDSLFTERLDGSGYDLVVTRYPLSRYEYDCDGIRSKKIQIRQQEHTDTLLVESLDGSKIERVVHHWIEDIPEGEYVEYYPDGQVRMKGKVDGVDARGLLIRVGEWVIFNEHGAEVSRHHYP